MIPVYERQTPKSIGLYFTTSDGSFVSSAIRWTTRSPFSHAGFVARFADEDWYLSAHFSGGVRWRNKNEEQYTRIAYGTAIGIEQAFEWAKTQVGRRYDWRAIAGFALRRNWREPDSWFCSELVARAFEMANAPLLNPGEPVWRISPRDLRLSMRLRKFVL